MNRTDTSDPNYYHKVVDCQWACPAHTNVPEYIRMIAQGRFDDAYILNRESNVFPGILGRTCITSMAATAATTWSISRANACRPTTTPSPPSPNGVTRSGLRRDS